MKNKFILFGVMLLFSLMLVNVVSATTTYTPSTDTTCIQGAEGLICNKVLYSGIINVYEDNQWKKIEDARSLKGSGIVPVILEDDKDFPIEVIDYNYTSITVKLNPKGITVFSEDVPIRVWEYNQTKTEIFEQKGLDGKIISEGLTEDYKDTYTNVIDEKIKYNLLNQQETKTLNFKMGNILEFGYNSTTIILQTADTENLDDTYVSSNFPSTIYGTATSMYVGDVEIIYIKFNISELPNNIIISSAKLSLYLGGYSGSQGADHIIDVHHVYSNYTWNEETMNYTLRPNSSYINSTYESRVPFTADLTTMVNKYYNFSVTNMINTAYNLNYNNITIMLNESSGQGGSLLFRPKESSASLRPKLIITYLNPLGITITYPTTTNYTTSVRFLNWTVGGDVEQYCWYSNNGGATNTSVTCGALQTSITPIENVETTIIMWANDSSNNLVRDDVTFTMQSIPYFITIPANVSMIYPNSSFLSKFVATDDISFGYYSINDSRFIINQTGFLKNNTYLSVGNYEINVTINDTVNNINWTRFTVQVNKSNENCWVLFNETSPLVYSKPFKVWANCSSAFVLARNGTTIVNNSDQSLAVGAYNFSFSRNDTGNYTIIFNQSQFIIANSTIISKTANALGYETGTEIYYLNITSPVVPTNARLVYDGFPFAATVTNIAGSFYNLSATIQINSSMIGANTFYYEWNLTSNYKENSINYNQNIDPIQFGLCNGTLTIPYLNFTFKDETTSDWINATIPTSTFIYYLGDGSVFKTLTYYQLTPKLNYTFCALPSNLTYYIDPSMQYDSGVNYIQRTYNPDVATYTNSTTNTTLFLLGVGAGSSVTFQVVNILSQSVDGVLVNVVRIYGDSNETIGTGTTDSAGIVTFTLNQEYTHSITFSKTGYTTYTILIVPTQSLYTVTLSSTLSIGAKDYTRGIKTYLYPKNKELSNDTSTNFIFNVTSSYWDLDSFGFRLRLANGTIVGTASSTVEGTGATYVYNINNQTIIYMDYYWKIEGNYTNSSTYWVVTNTLNAGWSIKNLFIDVRLYIDSGMFGLNDFGRYMISFIILFLIVGLVGYKFGIQNTILMSATIFIVVFFLDVVVGLIPAVRGIENLVTYVAGLLLAVVTINEVVTR